MPDYRVGLSHDLFRADGSAIVAEENFRRLAEAGCAAVPLPARDAYGPADLDGLHALIVRQTRVPGETLRAVAAKGFRHVARFGSGFDRIDIAAANLSQVVVTTTPDAVTRPVAVANISLVLSLASQVVPLDALLRAGNWAERGTITSIAPYGRTLGIVGLGRIGKETARLALGLGMRVVACTGSGNGGADGVELLDFDAVLSKSDFLCLACPQTDTNRGMMGTAQFEAMKPGAYFINTARGGLVDEAALYTALTDGHLAGAALDVFSSEPIKPDHPLIGLKNVLLTPHAIATSDDMLNACWAGCVEAVLAVRDGRPPASVITDFSAP